MTQPPQHYRRHAGPSTTRLHANGQTRPCCLKQKATCLGRERTPTQPSNFDVGVSLFGFECHPRFPSALEGHLARILHVHVRGLRVDRGMRVAADLELQHLCRTRPPRFEQHIQDVASAFLVIAPKPGGAAVRQTADTWLRQKLE